MYIIEAQEVNVFYRVALDRIQRNVRAWLALRNWAWWRMYTRVKPLLSIARQEDEMRQAAEELKKTKEEMEKLTDIKKQLEERNAMMERELQDLKSNAGATEESLAEAEDRIQELMKVKFEFEDRLKVSMYKEPRYLWRFLALWQYTVIFLSCATPFEEHFVASDSRNEQLRTT